MKNRVRIKLSFISIYIFILIGCINKKQTPCQIPEEVTYTDYIAALIETNCFECHAPDVYKKKASRNKIYDYPSLKSMGESGQLIGSITHAKGFIAMPYRKGIKIDSCDIMIFQKWVTNGMKE